MREGKYKDKHNIHLICTYTYIIIYILDTKKSKQIIYLKIQILLFSLKLSAEIITISVFIVGM